MNRTGSISSRVPPADTTTRRPAISGEPAPSSRRRATAKISDGSGSRPAPLSAPVRRPTAGSSTTAPRRRSTATLAWVAGCSHISVCMAGVYSTGHLAVSNVAVSRSPAIPAAARASRSAVAGATTTRSADWPSRTCGTSDTPVHTSVVTGSPDRAAQVGSPTKRRASAVGTTRTRCPDSVSSLSSSQALYAAMPAPTPRMTRADAGMGACSLAFGGFDVEQPLLDLTERDRQRLLLAAGLDQRADVLQQPLAELGVVRVDLPCALRGHDHQPVLAVHDIEKLVDRRVDDARSEEHTSELQSQ